MGKQKTKHQPDGQVINKNRREKTRRGPCGQRGLAWQVGGIVFSPETGKQGLFWLFGASSSHQGARREVEAVCVVCYILLIPRQCLSARQAGVASEVDVDDRLCRGPATKVPIPSCLFVRARQSHRRFNFDCLCLVCRLKGGLGPRREEKRREDRYQRKKAATVVIFPLLRRPEWPVLSCA